jgi:hypothetical protein
MRNWGLAGGCPQSGFGVSRSGHVARQCPRMPRTTRLTPALEGLILEQDGLVTAAQLAAHDFGRNAAQHRVGRGEWQRLLPGVLLTASGEPTRRQRVIGAWLWGGPGSAIDGPSACDWYGVRPEGLRLSDVHLVVPFGSPARSQSFVSVRRSIAEIQVGGRTTVPYVDPATALIVGARAARNERAAIAVLSRGLQQGLVCVADLSKARECLGDKWCSGVDVALVAVGVGLRSSAERDMHDLIVGSHVLPEPLWNQWVDLGDGGPLICLDALFVEAALVNEVEGKKWHGWGMQFEDMHARHERMTAAGLIVLHATPTRIRREGGLVLARLEDTYRLYAGRGLPANVRLVPPPQQLRIP